MFRTFYLRQNDESRKENENKENRKWSGYHDTSKKETIVVNLLFPGSWI